MICVLEIGMLIFGIYVIVSGKMPVSKNKVVQGATARLIGIIGLVPLPAAFIVGVIYGVMSEIEGQKLDLFSRGHWTLTIIEAAITLGCFALMLGLGFALGKPPQKKQPPPDDYEDDYDADAPPPRRDY